MRSLLVCAVVVSMPALGRAQSPEPREPSAEELAALTKEGHSLSPAQARALLEQLRRDPNDFRSRFRLIAYHGRGGGEAGPHGEPYDSLVLGLIERHPRWRASGEVFLSRGESFEKGVKLWLRLAEANPRDARILGNAGFFLTPTSSTSSAGKRAGRCCSRRAGSSRGTLGGRGSSGRWRSSRSTRSPRRRPCGRRRRRRFATWKRPTG